MKGTRYAYVKNGDVVEQLARLSQPSDFETTSGPDAFLNDFLGAIKGSPLLLLGHGDRNAAKTIGEVDARVISDQLPMMGKAAGRLSAALKVLFSLLLFKPDRIICGRTGGMLWASTFVSLLYSVPLVHSRHNQIVFENIPWYRRFSLLIDDWCIKYAYGVICHGPYLKQQLSEIQLDDSQVYEFDIDFSDMLSQLTGHPINIDTANSTEKNTDKNTKILFIGRIQKNKGVFDLLDAVSGRLKHSSGVKLIYVGDGPDIENLKSTVRLANLTEKVEILGSMPHREIGLLLAGAKLVVTPTQPEFPEGRCMVVMEAQVAGIPVIAPSYGPFPYLIEDQINGLLYRAGSVTDLQSKIDQVLDNKIVYEKVKSGAVQRGIKLRSPTRTFSEAVLLSFREKVV